ncbi:hypothetical protein D041_4159B, partial [Vibrio parahaemolyticus EKP-008]
NGIEVVINHVTCIPDFIEIRCL